MDEIIDPKTGEAADPEALLTIEIEETVYYRGTAERLLELLNGIEQHYNALGQSLRTSDHLWSAALVDPLVMRLQLLHDLGIDSEPALGQVRDPLTICPQLALGALRRSSGARALKAADMLRLEQGAYLSAGDFVERINAQQDLVCALGWDMLGAAGADGWVSVEDVMSRRQAVMTALGISRFHPTFAMRPLAALKPFGEIVAEAERAAATQQVPTVLDLRRLRGEMPSIPAYQVPDLPAIATVEPPPPPRPLELHKNKYWDGFHLGDRGLFAVEADGSYGLHSSETAACADAVGQASVHLAHHELRILKARGVARGTEAETRVAVYLEVLGKTVAEDVRADSLTVSLVNAELLGHEMKKAFTQRFAIGPIPIEVNEGVSAHLRIGADMAVRGVKLAAAVTPQADARAFVTGAVGVESANIAAGAGSDLSLLQLDAPLQGNARFELYRDAEPSLVGEIDVGLGYSALNGRVYVYAKVPLPHPSWPPWKVKTVSHDLVNWPGFNARRRLIGWGLRVSSSGTQLLGDLSDESDRDEAAALQTAIDAERRTRELARLEQAVAEREAHVFEAIHADVGGEPALRVLRDVAFLQREHAEVGALFAPLQDNLVQLLRELARDSEG